ncbi:Rz1-like lysis system protein LysC [Reyranella massiliensis]|uniref:Rz1-like lysis system protein LysC n=1 Tax=Reyranella massiliensis TaxID=445220 RepID=UPI003CCAC266
MLHQPRPSAELLQRCREPMRPARGKTLNQNGEAFADLAAAFRECSARMDRIVDWHGEQPETPASPTEAAR